MRGRIITSDHRIFELPVLLRWNITYTGGVPCDSYEVTCVYDRTMAELLHLAAGFLALDENGGVLLRGIVDEYEVKLTAIPIFLISGFATGVAYIISGIPFDLLHAGGNFLLALLLLPTLRRLLDRLTKALRLNRPLE